MGEGGRGTSSSPFPQGELWGKGKPSGELVGELYIGEGEGGTLGEKQPSVYPFHSEVCINGTDSGIGCFQN